MEDAPLLSDELYKGCVPVLLKHPDREDRHTALTVHMSYGIGQPRNQKVLHVQLTDEADAFLLYNLDISEDDFHALKSEQSLLVDFLTFPSKLVELLRLCQEAAEEDNPHFVTQLTMGVATPQFTITEINPFRQLAHLSLRFVAGNDAAIKKYLARRLLDFKASLAATEEQLSNRTKELEAAAATAAAGQERLRSVEDEHARAVNELQARSAGMINENRERALVLQQEQSRLAELERARLIERHETEMAGAKSATAAAEATAGRLTAAQHEMQIQLRDATTRLEALEEEATLLRGQNQHLRQENSELSALRHSHEKAASAREIELAALAQAVKDKEALVAKTTSLLEAATAAKLQQEEAVAMHKDSCTKLQAKLKSSAAEISRGNQIIGKLQTDARALKSKLKLKAAVLLQQQHQLSQKQQAVDAADRAAAELRTQLAELGAEKQRAEDASAECRRQLTEAQELLRSNQQVIQWLNKELNDAQSVPRPFGGSPGLLTASASKTPPIRSSFSSSAKMNAASLPTSTPVLPSETALTSSETERKSIGLDAPIRTPSANEVAAPAAPAGAATISGLRSRAGIACLDSAGAGRPKAGFAPPSSSSSGFREYLSPSANIGIATSG